MSERMLNVMMLPLFNGGKGQLFLVYIILLAYLFDFHCRSGIMYQHSVNNGLLKCRETGSTDKSKTKLNCEENQDRGHF